MDSLGSLESCIDPNVPTLFVKGVLVNDQFLLQLCYNTLVKTIELVNQQTFKTKQ